jgi:5-methylcytosine-specific restriction protein B
MENMRFEEIVTSIKSQRPELRVEERNDGCAIWLPDGIEPAQRLLRVSRTANASGVTIKRAVSSLIEEKDVLLKFDGSMDDFLEIVEAEISLLQTNTHARFANERIGVKLPGNLLDENLFRSEIESLFKSAPAWEVENWFPRLQQYLLTTRGASAVQLRDREFLKELFEADHVSATGMCTVRSSPAIEDDNFVKWFSNKAARPLPTDPQEAAAWLVELHDETAAKFREL